ncbi:MAG: DegT/DnrJ/EryC1/StrS family aminotransferase [Dehalococcoidia bacterium]|nr:DegT/DnrJ/EryC1/StrS family aminotransferase [Dehalococcoidia bacterium]
MVLFFDLKAQYLSLKLEVDAAIGRVLEGGRFILGDEVAAFESEFAGYLGANHVVSVGSGTEALHLSLLACGVGSGDEVITVSHTATATVAAIAASGARPVFVDVDPDTYNIDAALIEEKITDKTRAIVPVHLYGRAADMSPIMEIARRRGLKVIEDACQAHGAYHAGARVGTIGDAGCFSFYPTKNLGAYGDGGAIATNDPLLYERLRMLRVYGWKERDDAEMSGYNSRLDELQAAVLRVKLRYLDQWNRKRVELASIYDGLLDSAPLVLPNKSDDASHVYHLYVVRSDKRDRLRAFLQENGIGTMVHYTTPVHLQPAYVSLAVPNSLPNTEKLVEEILSLPLYPELGHDSVEHVASLIKRFYKTAS